MSNWRHTKKFKVFLLTTGLLLGLGSVAGRSGTLAISFNHPPQEKKCAKGKRLCPDGDCVDKNESCAGRQFLLAADYYFSRAKDPKTVEALLGLMNEEMYEFISRARTLTSLGCESNEKPCPNGSCVRPGTGCNSPTGFKDFSSVFQKETRR